MRGIIFTEFATFVEEQMGLDALDRAIEASDLPSGGAYTSVSSYPYTELETLLGTLIAQNSGLEAEAALENFGFWLAGRFKTAYTAFFTPHDNAIDFLASIDNHIHAEVRKLEPGAVPPRVVLVEETPDRYRLTYQSHRPLAQVALGLTKGSLAAYGDHWTIAAVKRERDDHYMTVLLTRKEAGR